MLLPRILKESLEKDASDIILSSNSKPALKIMWEVVYMEDYEVFSPEDLKKEIDAIMWTTQKEKFKNELELDFSIELQWFSRFRVNTFIAKNGVWAVFRPIKVEAPNFEDLWLPVKLLELIKRKNGLLLLTWSVGSGKSTTMAALIEKINTSMHKHIITVEDPVEFVFKNKNSIIEQREVGANTKTFENGLKYSLRQAGDVIMIWEMRDLETFRLALRAAETGSLVIATLHTSGAARTISRIVDMFPWDEKDYISAQLADSLIWVIWQELIKSPILKKRVLASELLINNTWVSNMIRKWLLHQIDWAIETWAASWMYTMEMNLEKLKKEGKI